MTTKAEVRPLLPRITVAEIRGGKPDPALAKSMAQELEALFAAKLAKRTAGDK